MEDFSAAPKTEENINSVLSDGWLIWMNTKFKKHGPYLIARISHSNIIHFLRALDVYATTTPR